MMGGQVIRPQILVLVAVERLKLGMVGTVLTTRLPVATVVTEQQYGKLHMAEVAVGVATH